RDARIDAGEALATGLPDLLARFAKGQEQGPGKGKRADEEVEPAAWRAEGSDRMGHARHREDALGGSARKEVAHTEAFAGQQAVVLREARLDLGCVGGAVGDHEAAGRLFVPAEGR